MAAARTAARPAREPAALPHLGGLTAAQFMRRHWQRKPLLVRQAFAGIAPLLDRAGVFSMAARADVESRLIVREGARQWTVRHGPHARRSLPPVQRPGWTVLLQGLDLHLPAAHQLLRQFAFLPAARLDDAMLSWASDGGGVGPHFDSYDVFLVQVTGKRLWRIGRSDDLQLVSGLPLKILRRFVPEEEHLLEPGDMLYLPPRWAHDGVAVGECTTCSIGFRAPAERELAVELLGRVGDVDDDGAPRLYSDAGAAVQRHSAEVPAALQQFAQQSVQRLLSQPQLLPRLLGEWLSEPKPNVVFTPTESTVRPRKTAALVLAPATRMLHDRHFIFINGESYRASGRDARLMRRLADERQITAADVAALSEGARGLLLEWVEQGWVHVT